ncbi:MAG: amidase [Edaphobacter sp.]|uniref:amidase n=1 Tax=Edaphobacter sp. TaxID=1934404 RepID=UPI0023A30A0F|nr:amidase [Edaphobacter sp.]MDE1176012.1 amidase [Edaphobacter sp.]
MEATVSPAHALQSYREALDDGRLSSRKLIDQCLKAASDPRGEGARVFTKIYTSMARDAAEAADYLPVTDKLPLRGLPISIKDLFDVRGETTRAGSVVLDDAAPAMQDAEVVTRLKDAGAVLVGRTNMTEFAFSGLGLNPHYGTPRSPYARSEGRIPGGSSSGAAVSVSDGMAVAAIGSDTGGSIRIPAALCGLTGFKPTARRVSTAGVLPLSTTLDSIGPIAPTVSCCAMVDQVLSGDRYVLTELPLAGLRFGILQGYVLDGMEPYVASCFQAALTMLSEAGATLTEVRLASLADIPVLNRNGGFSGYEAYRWHRILLERAADRYDPRVSTRILRGKEISDADYATLARERVRIITEAEEAFADVDAWLMPTVPRVAPRIADLETSDEAYFDANAAMLRNPSLINFLDGCSISVPCHMPGDAPVGLMLSARGGGDAHLLSVALSVEKELRDRGCAIAGQRAL